MGLSLNPLDDLSSALDTGEKIVADGATDFKNVMGDAAKVVTHMSPSEIGHSVLNVAGMIPVIGAPADAINAGWYAAEGDWGNAALSAATAIPGLGDVVGGAKLGANALKIAEDGVKAERLIKDGTEAASTAKNAEKALEVANATGGAGAEAAGKGAEEITKAVGRPAAERAGARFGLATSDDYRATFFAAHPELEGQVVVHHAVEQQVLTRYPGVVSKAEMHSLENLRGIPTKSNPDLHLSQIRREWNQFYRQNPNPTKQLLLEKATEIDARYGSKFNPPR